MHQDALILSLPVTPATLLRSLVAQSLTATAPPAATDPPYALISAAGNIITDRHTKAACAVKAGRGKSLSVPLKRTCNREAWADKFAVWSPVRAAVLKLGGVTSLV